MASVLRFQRKQCNPSSHNWRLGMVPPLLLSHFGIVGATLGATGVLLPEVMSALQMSEGLFGRVLLTTHLFTLGILLMAGQLTVWLGRKHLALLGLSLLASSRLVLAAARSLWGLAGALALTGTGVGIMDMTMNGAILDCKQVGQRGILNIIHAGFSASAMLGAFGTGILLALNWNYSWVLMLIAVPSSLALIPTLLMPYPDREHRLTVLNRSDSTLRLLLRQRGLSVLAFICLLNAICESMGHIWLVLYLQELGAPVLISSAAFALFNGSIFVGRLVSAPLVAHLGPRISLFVSSLVVILTGTMLMLPGSVVIAVAAFVLLGLAVSGVVSTVLSVAANLVPGQSSVITGSIFAAVHTGFMIMPPLVGGIAELFSLQTALATIGVCCGLGMLVMMGVVWRVIK